MSILKRILVCFKGAEATYVEKFTVMKKKFRLKGMLDFNVL